MQYLHSGTPSGLQLRQPQRYSDRHQVTGSGSGKYQSRGSRTAQVHGAQDNSTQTGEGGQDGKASDDQGNKP